MQEKWKKIMILVVALLSIAGLAIAAVEDAYVIDDFDDMDFAYDNAKLPAWFKFDGGSPTVKPIAHTNQNKFSVQGGKDYLSVDGKTSKNDWYVGGIGRDFKKDVSKYNAIQLLIYGYGKDNGKIAIQIYDVDDKSGKIEQDSNYIPTNGGMFEAVQTIDWEGWKLVSIPFSDFICKNPKVGNGNFDPENLMRVQVIFLPNIKSGPVKFGLDNIAFVDEENQSQKLMVDNFEDGSLDFDFEKKDSWWNFGAADLDVVPYNGKEPLAKETEKGVLKVSGATKDWYVGGIGKYLAIDASMYKKVKMMIYGNGPESGVLQIELYDDDNNTLQLEQDAKFNPLYDDKWVSKVPVTWHGWKWVTVPFYKFKDENKTIGDNLLNLDQNNGSGGLLHFQLIFLSTKKEGAVSMMLDNIRLSK